jgi:3-deoxy-D-manno-octulosonic-acid transferase
MADFFNPKSAIHNPQFEVPRRDDVVLLYNLLWLLAFVIASPVLLVAVLLNWKAIRPRLGWGSVQPTSEHPIWVHAASMGEVQAAAAILCRLKRLRPDLPIVISTTSLTGYRRAKHLLGDVAQQVFIAPLDFSPITYKILRRLAPRALLLVETEIWPNLIRQAEQAGCRIALVNGKLSPKKFPRYLRIRRLIAGSVRRIELICTQSEDDRRRFLALEARPGALYVTGNVKVDASGAPVEKKSVRRALKLPDRCGVLVGGSTHEGEEEALIESFCVLRRFRKSLKLILAPRYVKRVEAVASLARSRGLSIVRKSALEDRPDDRSYDVLIVDTMGELGWIYGAGDVAFVGGSLVPVGGHNPFEPLRAGVPVVFGPNMNQEGAGSLLKHGAALQIKDAEELTRRLRKLLDSPERRRTMVASGKALMREREKSAEQTAALLIEKGIVSEFRGVKRKT